jgi:hypothetical protein
MASVDDLPDELIRLIFTSCYYAKLPLVCKRWNELCDRKKLIWRQASEIPSQTQTGDIIQPGNCVVDENHESIELGDVSDITFKLNNGWHYDTIPSEISNLFPDPTYHYRNIECWIIISSEHPYIRKWFGKLPVKEVAYIGLQYNSKIHIPSVDNKHVYSIDWETPAFWPHAHQLTLDHSKHRTVEILVRDRKEIDNSLQYAPLIKKYYGKIIHYATIEMHYENIQMYTIKCLDALADEFISEWKGKYPHAEITTYQDN